MTALTKPLPELERILSIQQMSKPEYIMFIDYSKLFESALLLQDDVLEPTLAMVKDRLMDIQVCLGEIDAWIMETKENIGFLENTFGIDLTDSIHIVSSGEKKVLKKFKVSGKHEATFDISMKRDRKRLTKFIEFLKIEEE